MSKNSGMSEPRIFVVAIGKLPRRAQKGLSGLLKPQAFANFISNPEQALIELDGFVDTVILGICAKRADQVIICGHESMPEQVKYLTQQVAKRTSETLHKRRVKFDHALWNGKIQISGYEDVIEVPDEENSDCTCVGCIDCKSDGGIEYIVQEIGGNVCVLRIPGAGLQEFEKPEHLQNPFLKREIALIKAKSKKVHILNHEGCAAFTTGEENEIKRAGLIWTNQRGFSHRLARVNRAGEFKDVVSLE